jgi:DNA-directed RNA polymerase I subunit RPA2
MVKNSLKPLEDFKEDSYEVGGFFIVNGLEKLLRNIIIPKRNFPVGVIRPSFSQRRKNLTDFAVMIKCSNHHYIN